MYFPIVSLSKIMWGEGLGGAGGGTFFTPGA